MLKYFLEHIKPLADSLDELQYVDLTNCPHTEAVWTEERVTASAQYVGYKCTFCGQWVDKEEETND